MYFKALTVFLCLSTPAFGAVWLGLDATVPTLPQASSDGPVVAKETTTTLQPTSVTPESTTEPIPTPTTTVTPTTSSTTTVTSTTPSTTTVTSTTPSSTTTTSTTTTTEAPTSTSTTVAPTTSTTTTTAAPTSSSTTTSPDPTTTTPAPSTTTAPPAAGEWIVKDGNISCVVAKMDFHINVSYPSTLNTTKYAVLTPLNINSNGTSVEGKCGNVSQEIVIPLSLGSLTLEFGLNSSKSSLTSIHLNVTGLPDSIVNVSSIYNESSPMFETPVKMSYKCSKEQSVNLTNAADNSTAVLVFSDAQLQAFRTDSAINFSDAQDCEGADTPDMVPIAVGISLGVMIVVVLVAYLIGRRRSQSRGYVSM